MNENEFNEVIGSQATKPSEIDVTTSAYYVYERKDIKKYQEKDADQNVLFDGWQYLERKIPKELWQLETTKKNNENLNAIMMGLTDLYEMQIGDL